MKQRPKPLPKYDAAVAIDALAAVLAKLESAEEVRAFLEDLCTPAELEAMGDRWRVVPQLLQGVPYREIHEHEMRHVRAYQAHLKAIEKTLADALQARFAGTGPWRGPRGETNARLQAELQERWVPFVKREINKVDAAQALIDTPEEYARVAASCGGEIRRLTR